MGSNFVRFLLQRLEDVKILVYDKLVRGGRIENLKDIGGDKRLGFLKGDICDKEYLEKAVQDFEPEVVVNLAVETDVNREVDQLAPFIKTNIYGVCVLLEVLRRKEAPLFIHISTDGVYGELPEGVLASEDFFLNPSTPLSASKASADLMVKSYFRTYGVKAIIVRPSSCYGPFQHPENFIPKAIIRALHDVPIPIHGDGMQVRDWLYVEDFCEGLYLVILKGAKGETYNLPGFNARKNVEVARKILELMGKSSKLIKFVKEKPGYDKRRVMKGDRILALGWRPKVSWREGLQRTIRWYVENEWWWRPILSGEYFTNDYLEDLC